MVFMRVVRVPKCSIGTCWSIDLYRNTPFPRTSQQRGYSPPPLGYNICSFKVKFLPPRTLASALSGSSTSPWNPTQKNRIVEPVTGVNFIVFRQHFTMLERTGGYSQYSTLNINPPLLGTHMVRSQSPVYTYPPIELRRSLLDVKIPPPRTLNTASRRSRPPPQIQKCGVSPLCPLQAPRQGIL